jgi:hypothetical protein
MSFEILESPQPTVYAPLNTTVDADRDYYSLTGLDACACGGGGIRTRVQMGTGPHPAAGSQPNGAVAGLAQPPWCPFYQGGVGGFYSHVPEGMYTPDLGAVGGDKAMLWYLAGVVGLWAWWAWRTPHEPMAEW